MSYQLKIDEMLDLCQVSDVPGASELIERVETLASEIAAKLAAHLGVACDKASFQGTDFAGTCAVFHPAFEGQPLPRIFEEFEFDNSDEWAGEIPAPNLAAFQARCPSDHSPDGETDFCADCGADISGKAG